MKIERKGPNEFPSTIGIFPNDVKVDVVPCGSKFVCDPPVVTTDEDYLVWSSVKLDEYLRAAGFVDDAGLQQAPGSSRPTWGESDPDLRFTSWKKGDINLIVTESEEFALKHECATRLCQKFNVLGKQDRIAVYQAILYGSFEKL